jgi:hypothetical protein
MAARDHTIRVGSLLLIAAEPQQDLSSAHPPAWSCRLCRAKLSLIYRRTKSLWAVQ